MQVDAHTRVQIKESGPNGSVLVGQSECLSTRDVTEELHKKNY